MLGYKFAVSRPNYIPLWNFPGFADAPLEVKQELINATTDSQRQEWDFHRAQLRHPSLNWDRFIRAQMVEEDEGNESVAETRCSSEAEDPAMEEDLYHTPEPLQISAIDESEDEPYVNPPNVPMASLDDVVLLPPNPIQASSLHVADEDRPPAFDEPAPLVDLPPIHNVRIHLEDGRLTLFVDHFFQPHDLNFLREYQRIHAIAPAEPLRELRVTLRCLDANGVFHRWTLECNQVP